MKNEFKNASKTALEMLKNCGFEAFLIGGSVRDFIMGKEIGDIDVTTNAVPDEVKSVFAGFRVIETGIKHGTVTAIIDGEPVEITTYRSEAGYTDNRHPDSVTFSDRLSDDVIRRDFTMNGIAYDFENGFCDYVGGIDDIKNKTIRCIGDPEARFHEDALRILRAVRFSSVLGFEIEKETKKAVHNCRGLLKNISAERVREETVKLLCGKNAYGVLSEFPDVIAVFIPEILPLVGFGQHNRHHIYDAYEHTVRALEGSKPEPRIRLALLFHDLGKPKTATVDEKGERHFYSHPKASAQMAEDIMARLKFDNDTKNAVTTLVRYHDTPITINNENRPDKKRIKKIMSQIGEELIYDLIEIKRCDNMAHAPEYVLDEAFYSEAYEIIDGILTENECFTVKDLNIGGNDLIKMGFKGKEIGEKLNECLSAVINEKVENDFKKLKNYINP